METRAGIAGELFMRAIKYLGRLWLEFLGFAWKNKAWWILPVILVLFLLAFLIFTARLSSTPCFEG